MEVASLDIQTQRPIWWQWQREQGRERQQKNGGIESKSGVTPLSFVRDPELGSFCSSYKVGTKGTKATLGVIMINWINLVDRLIHYFLLDRDYK